MNILLFVNTQDFSSPKKGDVIQQTKAKQNKTNTITELKQMPCQVSQEINVKEIKNILYG